MIKLALEAKMTPKNLRISVVIPAYNEELRIKDCLDALMLQTVKPLEIIVVDNNCTDKTAAIAKKYKGVTVVNETVQGKAYAQSRGFDYAKGDILGRFDADTILPPNWVERVAKEFLDNPTLVGLSGYGTARLEVNIPKFLWKNISTIWSWTYFTHCRAFFGSDILWGGNMAFRRVDWLKIRKLCIKLPDKNIHEDQDVSLALACIGAKVKIMPSLVVSVDFYETEYFGKYWHYLMMKRCNRRLNKAHPRSKLSTVLKIQFFKRCILLAITIPLELIYGAYTLANSIVRFVSRMFKRLAGK
jgi:cellulose synthase/poly-beta-1,6-N-acetylglucosamine synthase-like glycosyltransferase